MESNILKFKCTGMEDGGKISVENTGRGQDISPEFIIENLSPDAKTLAITLEDLSHPVKNFTHWIIWNIPATSKIKRGDKSREKRTFNGKCKTRFWVWHTPLCRTKTAKRKNTYIPFYNIFIRL